MRGSRGAKHYFLTQTDKSMEVTQREMKQHEAEERISALLKMNQVSTAYLCPCEHLLSATFESFLGDSPLTFFLSALTPSSNWKKRRYLSGTSSNWRN